MATMSVRSTAVESSCSRRRLDSDEALEDALRRELIDIAFTAGISDAETLCDRALRHLNKVGLLRVRLWHKADLSTRPR